MLTFSKFSGINNVLPAEQLVPEQRTGITPLSVATNIDIGFAGELHRRAGYSQLSVLCHENVHQAEGFILTTVVGDLTAIWPNDTRVVLYPSLSGTRVWYCNLPDGRTTFSNGLICGITDGLTITGWGVPVPPSIGALTSISGALFPGEYQYQLTYVRISDGLEGGPQYSNPTPVPDGGVFLSGLPVLDGYRINVYLTSHDGGDAYLAGATTNGLFSYIGKNDALTLPCRTEHLQPAPVGTVAAFWRGRALTAVGPVLYASRTNQYELFDPRRDFKQFSAPITLIQPVDDGLYVGTETELAFLAGTEFDKLRYVQVADTSVVLGSGVAVRGELVKVGQSVGQGSAMLCIAGGTLVAGFSGGNISRMTEGSYKTAATSVAATFRQTSNGPQYVAIPQ
jgi:hypothetical protein